MKVLLGIIIGILIVLFFLYVPAHYYYNFWGGLVCGILLVTPALVSLLNIIGGMFNR